MSPTARKEITAAADYIFKETGDTASVDRWVDKLLDTFALLTLSPKMGPPRKELRRGLRGRDLRKVFPKRRKKQ